MSGGVANTRRAASGAVGSRHESWLHVGLSYLPDSGRAKPGETLSLRRLTTDVCGQGPHFCLHAKAEASNGRCLLAADRRALM